MRRTGLRRLGFKRAPEGSAYAWKEGKPAGLVAAPATSLRCCLLGEGTATSRGMQYSKWVSLNPGEIGSRSVNYHFASLKEKQYCSSLARLTSLAEGNHRITAAQICFL